MIIKGMVLVVVQWVVLGVVAQAAASTLLVPTLEEVLVKAARVARVRIVQREAVTFDFEGTQHVCAYLYSAVVVESFKGDGERFSFVARGIDFVGLDGDYFVILQWRSEEARRKNQQDAPSNWAPYRRAQYICEQSAGDYFAQDPRQVMFVFDTAATKSLGGERLLEHRDSVLGYVGADFEFERRRIGTEEPWSNYVRWSDVQGAVRIEVERQDALDKEVPTAPGSSGR